MQFNIDTIKSTEWRSLLEPILSKHFPNIISPTIYPPPDDIFNAFKCCPFNDLKVVILGMDPYPNQGEANGLAFSISGSTKLPPSLRNIFKELEAEYHIKRTNPDLTDLAQQGVLLLNTALTVLPNNPGSHIEQWKPFTTALIQSLNNHSQTNNIPLVFMLWGNHAKSYKKYLTSPNILILEHTHPSPLSRKPFIGNNHFKLANEYLEKNNKQSIAWIS